LARVNGFETAPTRTVLLQRLEPSFNNAPPPIDHGRSRCLELFGERVIRLAVGRAKNNPRLQCYAPRGLTGTNNLFHLPSIFRCYCQCRTARPHTTQDTLNHIVKYYVRHYKSYRGDAHHRGFSCRDQYLAMAFAQLTYRESLRDIEACLNAMRGKLYHMGFRGRVTRSTRG
jgi:hypothetical protein